MYSTFWQDGTVLGGEANRVGVTDLIQSAMFVGSKKNIYV